MTTISDASMRDVPSACSGLTKKDESLLTWMVPSRNPWAAHTSSARFWSGRLTCTLFSEYSRDPS